MARLYPPVIEEVLPAFCLNYKSDEKSGATINVNFNLNRAVANAEIKDMVLRLRTISTNKYIITENIKEGHAISFNLIDGICSFSIGANSEEALTDLRVGQYYKLQLAFIDLNGTVGYWSTVGTIKCIAQPTVRIANFNANDTNIFNNEIIGEYIQNTATGDSSEKVYSYQFQLTDAENNIIIDTGVLLHNSSGDIASNTSIDKFNCYEELDDGKVYYLQYIVTTINGFIAKSPRYQIINIESIPLEKNLKLVVETGLEENYKFTSWAPWEEGVVRLYLDYVNSNDNFTVTGNFVILRKSSKDGYKSWIEIKRFRFVDAVPNQQIFYDYTVEQGITYEYAVQQYNKQGFYSKRIPAEKLITADFEDMYLYDGERQLKIRFNPKMNSFKNDLQEQKIDTIGSKHPFIFRNGNVCYKEFPIAGLISFQSDNALFFIEKDDTKITDDYRQIGLDRFEQGLRADSQKERINSAPIYNKTDLTSENITSERYFKLLVLDWLTNGKPKLFRSPTEGNYIVRLLNVSLSPKAELGRMLHEFTCTAYEVADFNYSSLIDLGFLSTSTNENDSEIQWSTKTLNELKKNEAGEYIVNLENKELTKFECIHFKPGDRIFISFSDTSDTLDIMIGTTGTYIYEKSKPIAGLRIIPVDDSDGFSRSITLQTKEYNYQEFDTISSVSSITQMGEQLIGPIDNFFEHVTVNSNYNQKDYAIANNVSLDEDFKVVELTEENYQPNKYYLKNSSDYYQLTNSYNQNTQYYERVYNGDKLKVSEILHLHVKKREIIPIFACYYQDQVPSSSGYPYLDLNTSNVRFMLTPYGQGYINYKTIASFQENQHWQGLGFLTQEEKSRAMTIKEITQFISDKLKLDKFCLFKAYIPMTKDGITDWHSHNERFNGQGEAYKDWIYDPLYNNEKGGWWPRALGEYNPTFSVIYEDGEEHFYDLSESKEITLQNIKVPQVLKLQNGVLAEIIYRVQYTDYAIETTNEQLKNLKTIYLQTKEESINNIRNYNITLYNKYIGNILYDKYAELLLKAKDAEQYQTIIEFLTNQAHNEQQEKLSNYLLNEFKLINSIMLQVSQLDMDLLDAMGDEYNINYRIYSTAKGSVGRELPTIKEEYDEYYLENKDYQIKPITFYKDYKSNISKVKPMAKEEITHYLLPRNDIKNALDICINRLNNAKQYAIDQLDSLGAKSYVGQFIEQKQQEGKELFFKTITLNGENIPIYELICLNLSGINVLKNISVLSDTWQEYLNLEAYPILSLDKNDEGYLVNNLNYYKDNDNSLDRNSYIYRNNGEFISSIEEALETLNANPVSGADENETLMNYEKLYGYYEGNLTVDNSGLYFAEHPSEILLGDITEDGNINISWLESHIDQIFASYGDDILFDGMINYLNGYNQFKTLPSPEPSEEYHVIQIKQKLKELINYYLYEEIDFNEEGENDPDKKNTLKSIFKKAYICKVYENDHINTLTNEQKEIIKNTILDFKVKMNSIKKRFKTDQYGNFDFDQEFLNLQTLISNWKNNYNNVAESQENPQDYTLEIKEKINNFNEIIRIKNDAIDKFNEIRAQIISMQENENISVNDNIKDVLYEQKEVYENAEEQLREIKELFINQFNLLQSNVYVEAYFDFLENYVQNLNNSSSESITLYLQYLQQAELMKNAILDEQNNYFNQQQKITEAWKNFLKALAEAYKTEVKERFNQ